MTEVNIAVISEGGATPLRPFGPPPDVAGLWTASLEWRR
jgi:hypothetical protein